MKATLPWHSMDFMRERERERERERDRERAFTSSRKFTVCHEKQRPQTDWGKTRTANKNYTKYWLTNKII